MPERSDECPWGVNKKREVFVGRALPDGRLLYIADWRAVPPYVKDDFHYIVAELQPKTLIFPPNEGYNLAQLFRTKSERNWHKHAVQKQ